MCEDLQKLFPGVTIFRMDNDTTRGKNGHKNILEQFSNTSPSILVGTQMIAKGHDFPFVTLVGILDADMSLHFSDFRSGERTFQLLTQVAGRSGRSNKNGEVIIQTYNSDHYSILYAKRHDYLSFYKMIDLHKNQVKNCAKCPIMYKFGSFSAESARK